MHLYNHGIVFVATTAVRLQSLTPHVSDVSHTRSLVPHTITNGAMAVPIQTFSEFNTHNHVNTVNTVTPTKLE